MICSANRIDVVCLQEIKTKFFTQTDANKCGNYQYSFNTEEKYLKGLHEKLRKCQKVSKWGLLILLSTLSPNIKNYK